MSTTAHCSATAHAQSACAVSGLARYTIPQEPSAPWCRTYGSVIGRTTRASPAPSHASNTSCRKITARLSIRISLGAHAVIGGHHKCRAQSIDLGQRSIDREIEPISLHRPRRVLVLHVVAGREIHQLGLRRCQKVRPIGQRALAEPGGIDFDAAGFDRQTGSAHAAAKQAAQLVLGSDDGHARACTRESGENRVRPEIRRIVHHHGVAGFTIEEKISTDAVNRWRDAGDNRDVVGVREAWQRRLDEPEEPDAHKCCRYGAIPAAIARSMYSNAEPSRQTTTTGRRGQRYTRPLTVRRRASISASAPAPSRSSPRR